MAEGKIGKIIVGFGLIVVTGMTLLYFNQAKLLYLPSFPIRHARDNPIGYRSPLDRGLKFQEITLKVDGTFTKKKVENEDY